MKAYLLRRILQVIPTFFGITFLTFIIIQLAPGNPILMKLQLTSEGQIADTATTERIIEETKKLYGLDKPLPVQYLLWVKRVLTLDFGKSYKDHRDVWDKIKERLPVTLQLNILSFLLIYIVAIPVGVFSAIRAGTLWDRFLTMIFFVLYSLPGFWLAVMLIMFFGGGEYWDVFPVYGISSLQADQWPFWKWFLDRLWHLVLPVFCLSYSGWAYLSRLMRAELLEVIREDYIRTAKAKGLDERIVIMKHALRNALLPIVTLAAYLLPALFGGSVIIESIFSIPGMGQLGFEAVLSRDYPVIMALTTISALLTLIGLLLSDITYAVLDPRIQLK